MTPSTQKEPNYAELLASEYLDPLFYFCLKKTGNSYTAEDLAGEIVCEALVSLRHGCRPLDFSAWLWRLARNRYAKWIDRAKRTALPMADEDIGEYSELVPGETDVEGDYILAEDLKLLRRELAFIQRDYRTILVAHYLENKSVSVIARETGLLLETVKTKLKNGRKKLKEGMTMAREFGALSYKPEQLHFSCSGWFGPQGEPWSLINRLLCKNVLFETYLNPSTAEELALELGIALPYMEDELNLFTDATLIQKTDNRYETNFVILSAEVQRNMEDRLVSLLPALTDKLTAVTEQEMKPLSRGEIPWEDKRWAALLYVLGAIREKAMEEIRQSRHVTKEDQEATHRPGGVQWDLVGYESYPGKDVPFVGCHSAEPNEKGDFFFQFSQYKIYFQNMAQNTPEHISYYEAKTLYHIACEDGPLDEKERSLAENLVSYGYAKKAENGTYSPTLLILQNSDGTEPPEKAEAVAMVRDYLSFCWDEIAKDLPTRLKNPTRQLHFALENGLNLRGMVLEEAIRRGWLRYEDTDREKKKYLGAVLYR